MHRILALWAHPRSLSTALERVFIERGDFLVMHEPFASLYYMLERRAKAAHSEFDADFDAAEVANYESIRHRIIQAAHECSIFFKDMCYHCYDHLKKDDSFLRQATHVFTIRDPQQAIASHFAKNPDVTCEEIGYETQASIFRRVWALNGDAPLVIVAEDLQRDSAGIVNALCNRIRLEHRAEALNWRPGHLEQWDNWKHWHCEVAASSSIHPSQTNYAKTVDNDSSLAEYHSHHEPFYLEMRRQRLIA